MTSCRQALSVLLSFSVTLSVIGLDGCKKSEEQPPNQAQQAGQTPATTNAVPSADQLYQLVAPIALFPDNLLAQVLAASTFPNEVTAAYNWVQQNSSLKGQQLLEAVNQQSWDPSVKGVTQFPDVLNQMATNLSWTSALGDAYFNYPSSVMNAVQVMRQRAQSSGSLKSNQQQTVTVQNQAPGAAPAPSSAAVQDQSANAPAPPQTVIVQPPPQTIIIQPAQPDVVYVPTYNPTVVYGAPVPAYPGYSTGAMVATSLLSFGVGIAVGAAISGGGGCCGWGWNSWNTGWHNNTVVYNHNTYISNSNTFVNRNNYYNHGNYNNVNVNNVNRNNVNANNYNRNNVNANNVNRNNLNNNNYRANNLNKSNYSEPHFNQKYDAPQYQNRNPGGQQNNFNQNRNQNPGQNRGGQQNFNQNRNQNPGQQNRQNPGQNHANYNQGVRNDASRGYGQQPERGSGSSAFGNYSQGGNARTNSARGQQSLQASRGGGGNTQNRGGGARQGGGARR